MKLLCALALSVLALGAQAQDKWPSKPITYVVPFAPGGTTDVLARLIGQKLSAALGTQIVVENKPGAGGNLGAELVARAAPDGYTILGGTISTHAINVSLYPKLNHDPVKSFAPVALIGSNPVVLVVNPASPYKSLADVIAAAKAQPKAIASASAGNGTSQHLSLEMLGWKSGAQFTHVPYKGSGPAIQDVIAGQVPMMFDTTVVAGPHIESGKLRALAVTSAKRLDTLPQVPTVAETVPGFEVVSWQAIFAPAGTPKPIVDRLHAEVMKILKEPEVQERLHKLGMQPSTLTPEQVAAFQQAEIAKWADVIKAANVRIE